MSHFVVMVIGEDAEDQLSPYDEGIEVDRYEVGVVSDEDKERMLKYYADKGKHYSSFDECYAENGLSWDGGRCEKNENGEWIEYSCYNPDSKWDWYVLGGRWSGAFIKLKSGRKGYKGTPGVGNNPVGIDVARKGDIDFDLIRSQAAEEARANYREVSDKFEYGIPKLEHTWKDICSSRFDHLSWEERRNLYHNQPSMMIWRDAFKENAWRYDIDEYQCSEEEYVKRAVLLAFCPYAIVKDGEWYAKGEMGWWGMSNDHMDRETWAHKVNELVDSLSDDTLISFYDCHI